MIRWWVAMWDRREAPDILAAIRIGVGAVLLGDFLTVSRLGLVVPLMSIPATGGMAAASEHPAQWFVWFGTGDTSAHALHAALVAAALSLTLGSASRTSALLLMFLSAQWQDILPEADRAIDVLLRNVLLLLGLSSAGARWSVDAWLRTGSWRGDGAPVPSWPRYLMVIQVVVMYFTAGVQKYGQHWWPWGGYTGLFVILNDWSYAAFPFGWLRTQPFYLSTQVMTAVTMVWQWTYPIVLLHYFPLPTSPGRFRRMFEDYRLHWLWIAIGALFHVLIGATMELGIFPWGMLAVYPAFLHPDELRRSSPPDPGRPG